VIQDFGAAILSFYPKRPKYIESGARAVLRTEFTARSFGFNQLLFTSFYPRLCFLGQRDSLAA
jgi:hypothetical protein